MLFISYKSIFSSKKSHTKIKSYEELENEKISNLIAQNRHPPTISFLSKCFRNKLPLVCDKCVQKDEVEIIADNDDYEEYSEEVETRTVDSKPETRLGPVGVCEYNNKYCIYYQTKRKSSAISNRSDRLYSAPLNRTDKIESFGSIRPYSSKSHTTTLRAQNSTSITRDFVSGRCSSSITETNKKKSKSNSKPMRDTDSYIKYSYTPNGLEIKRLSSKNFLIVDIFTSDVCKDQKEKSYHEWLTRKREIDEKKTKIYPSSIYIQQLEDLKVNLKKGRLTYEMWAEQSYKILLLKEKIRKAREIEDIELKQKNDLQKAAKIDNVYNLWKMKKDLYQSRMK
jgi:hypothetical protein